jgi:putative addiction module killer protein
MPFRIREFVNSEGRSPFRDWLDQLDGVTRARIQARILRFELGNLGDHRAIADGVWEARLTFGPGYRVYFGKAGKVVILLLVGGDKSSQSKDIARARSYWAQFTEDNKHGET